ncbi:MAG: FixH family protein [bacterium]|nr:FixH family protein [bacterium]
MHLWTVLTLPLFVAAPTWHPADRPLVDLTIDVASRQVRVTALVNVKFLDEILGTSGDPSEAPDELEAQALLQGWQTLLASSGLVTADGEPIRPEVGDGTVARPTPALRAIAPDYVRAMTQTRFQLTYSISEHTENVHAGWHFFPMHPLTEDQNSPLVPLVVRAVVTRPDSVNVLEFRQDSARHILDRRTPEELGPTSRDPAPPTPVANQPRGISTAPEPQPVALAASRPAWHWFALLIGSVAGIALLFGNRGSRASAAALLLVSLTACTHPTEPVRLQAETPAWHITVELPGAPAPVNELFGLELAIISRDGDGSSPAAVRVDADMPGHGHGMNTAPRVVDVGNGRWRAEGFNFHMPGKWEIYVDIGTGKHLQRATVPIEAR